MDTVSVLFLGPLIAAHIVLSYAWHTWNPGPDPRNAALKIEGSEEGVPCDPTSLDPDVGILSCGMGKYCSESTDNNLGGFCVDSSMMEESVHRDLQLNALTQFYNTSSPYYAYFDCDCTQFDLTTGKGDIVCEIGTSYCIDDANMICLNRTAYGTFSGNETYTIIDCYNCFLPCDQNVCYSTNRPIPSGCDLTFNGETCDACYKTFGSFANMYNVTEYYLCLQFDCTNTEGMNEGNICDGDYVSTILDVHGVGTPAPAETTALIGITPIPVEPPSTPAPAPDPTAPPAPASDPTAPPDGVSALLTTKNAISLMGLSSMAMLVHFAS
jgi:hypothetical protein